jgi:hypothetical protein
LIGSPTFYFNGIRYDDSWDEKTLLAAIEDILANSERRTAKEKKKKMMKKKLTAYS